MCLMWVKSINKYKMIKSDLSQDCLQKLLFYWFFSPALGTQVSFPNSLTAFYNLQGMEYWGGGER